MKLRRLQIGRLPGIDEAFAIEEIGDGFNVIVGPNGIGKSSLCRATRSLLWDEEGPDGYMAAAALFELEGQHWRVERDGTRYGWTRDGTAEAPPPLPLSHLGGSFFLVLRDLLEATRDAGSDLAARVRRKMSGGFDLDRAAEAAFGSVGERHGRKEQRAFDQAEQALRKAVGAQEQLADRETRLERLDLERAEAESAQRRLGHFERALELDQLRSEHTAVELELSALPPALSKLAGDELSQLDDRASELHEKRSQRTEKETAKERAEQAASETGLDGELTAAELATWLARAQKLSGLEANLEPAEREFGERRQGVAQAGRAIGTAVESVPTIDLSAAEDLFRFLREASQADAEKGTLGKRLALLEGREFSPEDRAELERLSAAGRALRAWLRAPDPDVGPDVAKGSMRSRLMVAIGILLLGGVVFAFWVHAGFALIAGIALGLAATLWLLRPDLSIGYARTAAKRDFPTGIEPPQAWAVDTTNDRLREVEGRIGELKAAEQRARDRGVERAELEAEREGVDERRAGLEEERQALASRLRLEQIPADAELVDMARALDQLRQAHVAVSRAEESATELRADYAELSGKITSFLTSYGEATATDAASARAGLDHLAARNHDFRRAKAAEVAAIDGLKSVEQDIERIERAIASIYARAEVEQGDRAGLMRMTDQVDRYRELGDRQRTLTGQIESLGQALSEAGEEELSQVARAALESEKARLEQQAAHLSELLEESSRIRVEVEQARSGHSLEETIAARESAVRSLEECRAEALRATVGRSLLKVVKEEHETLQMPRVLERARELFATFTHHNYELRVAPDEDGSFIAIEAPSGRARRPHQLSDGTRTQLILAAHLAFAEEAEGEACLPLFLDEALDQSDPARFEAIVKSLGRMVQDEARQIFYLTNDPMDVERIQGALREEGCKEAYTIDLGAIRKRTQSVAGAAALRVEPLPEVPAPEGRTPEEYAAALELPRFDPRRGIAAQHLLYVLWDDLELLRELLTNRIDRVGQWQLLSRNEAALAKSIAGAGGAGAELDARAQLLEVFCNTWSEGRGRPVEREGIERSGLSPRYLEDIIQISEELGGDAKRLLTALRGRTDARLQGFRSKATNDFESFLTNEGYLDNRPVREESDIRTQLLASPAAARLRAEIVSEFCHRWWGLCVGSKRTA